MMVINTNNDLNTSSSAQSRHKAGSKPAAPTSDGIQNAPAATDKADSVHLSSAAQQLKQLEASAIASEGFDIAKVESIKQKIANGEYTINAERIAAQMLANDALY